MPVAPEDEEGNYLNVLVGELMETYTDGLGINQKEGHDLPDRQAVLRSLERLFDICFPGFFFNGHPVTRSNLTYHIGDQLNHVLIDLTAEVERAFRYACMMDCCETCHVGARAHTAVETLLRALPQIRQTLKEDVAAGFAGDPASSSPHEVIISYPAVRAITTYRLAHVLYQQQVPLIPRLWSEHAHSTTGVDIHPGAEIGPSFFIDHGTGVVIGETCNIGSHVQIYQGVTLGALAPAKGQSIRGTKRHPTIEDNVTIYAGATILGGKTVIGRGSTIGGNVWLTESVDPGTKVVLAKADLVFLQPRKNSDRIIRPSEFRCPAKPLCEADGTIDMPPLPPLSEQQPCS